MGHSKSTYPVIGGKGITTEVVPAPASSKPQDSPRSGRLPRCFNCSEYGHISTQCTKPKRNRGACYRCGSGDHRIERCPKPDTAQQTTTFAVPDSTTMMVQGKIGNTSEYIVPFNFKLVDNIDNSTLCCSASALLDTGSPISLIKAKLVPATYYDESSELSGCFTGINGSELIIVGTFSTEICIKDVTTSVKFYVVPNETMKFRDLLD